MANKPSYNQKNGDFSMAEGSNNSVSAPTIARAAAAAMVRAAIEAAAVEAVEIAVAVTDSAGHLVAFERTDGARFLAVNVAIDKAWTAVSSGMATHVWNNLLTVQPALAPLAHHPRLLCVGGGYPIIDGGRIIGGIGVSGAKDNQDQVIAEQALATIVLSA